MGEEHLLNAVLKLMQTKESEEHLQNVQESQNNDDNFSNITIGITLHIIMDTLGKYMQPEQNSQRGAQ